MTQNLTATQDAPSPWRRAARVVVGAWGWLGVFWIAAELLLTLPIAGVAAAVLLLGVPAMAALWHQDAVDRLLALHAYQPGAFVHRWRERRVLPMAAKALAALVLAAFALAQAPFLGAFEWALLAAAGPAFALLELAVYQVFQSQYASHRYAQRGLRRLVLSGVVLLMSSAWILLRLADQQGAALPLGERVATLQGAWSTSPAHAVRWVLDAMAWGQAASESASSALPAGRWWQAIAGLVLAPLALFGYAALATAGLALPRQELRRAAAVPLTAAAVPPTIAPVHAGVWAAVLVLASWLWFDLAGHTEYLARAMPSPFAVQVLPACERIGGQAYRVGTEALLERLGAQTSQQLMQVQNSACKRLTSVRTLAEPGVDAYLDWYFTLGAEWSRLAAMLAGDAELLMRVKFEQLALQNPDINAALEAVQRDYAIQWSASMRARTDAVALLESQRMVLSESQCRPVLDAAISPTLLRVEAHSARLVTGPGAALAAGAFAGTVAAKAMSKLSMKAATKLLAKAAAKKGLGKAGAAVAGAAVGSFVVPGLGTAIGAGVGAAVGLALGAGIDLALLAAEEKLTRQDMRRDLLTAVDESLQPYRAGFSCP